MNEPRQFASKIKTTAYPTYEMSGRDLGLYGPAREAAGAAEIEWTQMAPTHRAVSRVKEECNWLQALEGGIDTSHATIMHDFKVGDLGWLRNYEATVPQIEVEHTGTATTTRVSDDAASIGACVSLRDAGPMPNSQNNPRPDFH